MKNENVLEDFVKEAGEKAEELLRSIVCDVLIPGCKLLLRVFRIGSMVVPIKRSYLRKRYWFVMKAPKGEDVLGFSGSLGVTIKNSDYNNDRNTLICGNPGSGKSELLMALQKVFVRGGKGIIYMNPKADVCAKDQFISLSKAYDREYYIFDEHSSDSMFRPLNPLKDGTNSEIVDRLTNSLEWQNEYYKSQSKEALRCAIEYCRHFDLVVSVHNILDFFETESPPIDRNGRPVFKIEDIAGLVSQLRDIDYSPFGKMLSDPDALSVSDVRAENVCLYIGLSSLAYPEVSRKIGKLFCGDFMYHSSMVQSQGLVDKLDELQICIDEFGSVATENIINVINKSRAAKMGFVFATQTPADLKVVSPSFLEVFVENIGNFFFFGQNSQESREFASNLMNVSSAVKETHSTERGNTTGRGSRREVWEYLCHPSIFGNLGVGQCVWKSTNPRILALLNVSRCDWAKYRAYNDYCDQYQRQEVLECAEGAL